MHGCTLCHWHSVHYFPELKSHCYLYDAQGQRQAYLLPIFLRAVGSLVVRASDSRPEGLEIVEVEIEVVSPSIVPSGNFAELKSHCHLYGAQGQRQAYLLPIFLRAVGSLVVRASDSRPEGLGSMPDATRDPPSTHGLTCRNCGGGDRGRVAIYRPFGELRRAKIALSPVWCSRPTTGVPLAHATMNFVGLVLTTSDRWHQKTTTTFIHSFNLVVREYDVSTEY
ncbi:hypothetical protein TNCV_4964861 [Trichonephila clavipes]|nr:hypothetical protein TNCV_4964861 [Trichonephila clavipes]